MADHKVLNQKEFQFHTTPFRRAKPKEIPTKYIYITNCGKDIDLVWHVCSQFGVIEQFGWADPRQTSAIFKFQDAFDAQSAVSAMDGKNCDLLENRKIHVEHTIPKTLETGPSPAVHPLIVMEHSGFVNNIPGLYIALEFISENEEADLLAHLDSMDWRDQIGRRVLHFGYRFNYKTRHVDIPLVDVPKVESVQLISHKLQTEHIEESLALPPPIPDFCTGVLDKFHSLLASLKQAPLESHLVDQITVNEYLPGQGIASHIDTHSAFHDFIASLSLESQVVMDFQIPSNVQVDNQSSTEMVKYSVLLPRRSLVLMTGESRYCWSHGIAYRVHDNIQGSVVKRSKRLSLTLRKVRFSRQCDCNYPSFCDTNK